MFVPPRPLWQLSAAGSWMTARCSGAVDPPVSLVGSICHHATPLCVSTGLPEPPIVVPAGCAAAASMTVCAVQSLPLRRTQFWMRESLPAMRVPETAFADCWRCGQYPPLLVMVVPFGVAVVWLEMRRASKRHAFAD